MGGNRDDKEEKLLETLDEVFENYDGEALDPDDKFNWEETDDEVNEGETVEDKEK